MKKNRIGQYLAGLGARSLHAFERAELMRTVVLALVALAIAYLGALGVHATFPGLGEMWEWVLGLWVVLLFIVIAPYHLWLDVQTKLEVHEEAARPKIVVSDPILTIEPKGAAEGDEVGREYRLRISNHSTALIENCYVKQASLVNKNGHESDVLGIHFKINTDQPHIIQSYEHRQSFDLPPGGHEIVSICGTTKSLPGVNVIMLYAIHGVGGQGIRNAIPRNFFPHILTAQVCADNLVHPVEIKYRLFFDDAGVFRMERLQHG